jgi:hypothetical protein
MTVEARRIPAHSSARCSRRRNLSWPILEPAIFHTATRQGRTQRERRNTGFDDDGPLDFGPYERPTWLSEFHEPATDRGGIDR